MWKYKSKWTFDEEKNGQQKSDKLWLKQKREALHKIKLNDEF